MIRALKMHFAFTRLTIHNSSMGKSTFDFLTLQLLNMFKAVRCSVSNSMFIVVVVALFKENHWTIFQNKAISRNIYRMWKQLYFFNFFLIKNFLRAFVRDQKKKKQQRVLCWHSHAEHIHKFVTDASDKMNYEECLQSENIEFVTAKARETRRKNHCRRYV